MEPWENTFPGMFFHLVLFAIIFPALITLLEYFWSNRKPTTLILKMSIHRKLLEKQNFHSASSCLQYFYQEKDIIVGLGPCPLPLLDKYTESGFSVWMVSAWRAETGVD